MGDLVADLRRASLLAVNCAHRMQKAGIDYAGALFELGVELSRHEPVHGEAFIASVATQSGLDEQLLHWARRFAEHFNCDWVQAQNWTTQRLQSGERITRTLIGGLIGARSSGEAKAVQEHGIDEAHSLTVEVAHELDRMEAKLDRAQRALPKSPVSRDVAEQVLETGKALLDTRRRLEGVRAGSAKLLASGPSKPARDATYLDFVRLHDCTFCGKPGPSEPHHFWRDAIGEKGSDYFTVPVCTDCHQREHSGTHLKVTGREWMDAARLMEEFLRFIGKEPD